MPIDRNRVYGFYCQALIVLIGLPDFYGQRMTVRIPDQRAF